MSTMSTFDSAVQSLKFCVCACVCVSLRLSGTLEPHLSALLWAAMLVSLAIVIVLPQPHGIRALIASTILRLIFSVGLEPTLFLLGAFNVSVCVIIGVFGTVRI